MNAQLWAAVGLGGAIGAMARYGVSELATRIMGPGFPWGTLTANVFGSALMGALVVWLARRPEDDAPLRAFLAVGVLGAFTTFSAFALDVVYLYRDRLEAAAFYAAGSVTLSILGLMAGMALARRVL